MLVSFTAPGEPRQDLTLFFRHPHDQLVHALVLLSDVRIDDPQVPRRGPATAFVCESHQHGRFFRAHLEVIAPLALVLPGQILDLQNRLSLTRFGVGINLRRAQGHSQHWEENEQVNSRIPS